jgi:hypothetical protein
VQVLNDNFQAVSASYGGTITLDDATVSGAGNYAVSAYGGDVVVSGRDTLVTGGTYAGVAASDGGSAELDSGNSSLRLRQGTTVQGNAGDGVLVSDSSVAEFQDAAASQITGNGGFGLDCDAPPALGLYLGSPGTVGKNMLGAVAPTCHSAGG